jgi:hypothetical protein
MKCIQKCAGGFKESYSSAKKKNKFSSPRLKTVADISSGGMLYSRSRKT